MKIRMGFVSNSSSSSFIVAFDKKPESVEEVERLLDLPEHVCCYDNVAHGHDVAHRVFSDVESNPGSAELEEELTRLFSAYIEDYSPPRYGSSDSVKRSLPQYLPKEGEALFNKYWELRLEHKEASEIGWSQRLSESERREKNDKSWKLLDEVSEVARELAPLVVREFLRVHEKSFILIAEYEDHSTLEAIMEHGNIFAKLEHIRVSHH